MRVAGDDRRSALRPGSLTFTPPSGFRTHVGFGRRTNEDSGWIAPPTDTVNHSGHLLAVADGMGGHRGGGYASQYACNTLVDYFRKLPQRAGHSRPKELCRQLTDVIYRIDRGLRFQGRLHPELRDMGTTLSCLVLTPAHSIIVHVGDSRIYRWRRGHLSCLTIDHTFVQEMITEGEVDPAQADRHPLRHLLTQAVGTGEPLEHVHHHVDSIKIGDRFLLCTDGLYNAVPDRQIGKLFAAGGDADTVAEDLLSQALANRASDNVTVLVTDVTDAWDRGIAFMKQSLYDR